MCARLKHLTRNMYALTIEHRSYTGLQTESLSLVFIPISYVFDASLVLKFVSLYMIIGQQLSPLRTAEPNFRQ